MMMIRFSKLLIYQLIYIIVILSGIICMSGCSTDSEHILSQNCQMIKCELIFTDSDNKSRGIISEFPDNAELYIIFAEVKTSGNWAKAKYSASEDKWTVEFPAEILTIGKGKCSVAYAQSGGIVNVSLSYALSSYVDLDENTSIMMTDEGEWKIYENVMVIKANLEPAFSRIRFVSDTPAEIWAKGFGIPYICYVENHSPFVSTTYPETLPCYPKLIPVKEKGQDGKYYSEYIYTHTNKCEDNHQINGVDYEYYDCPEDQKLSVYYPSETSYYYSKKLSEFKAGESFLVNLPASSDYSGWTKNYNHIKTISSEIKIGDGSNMNHTYEWTAESVIYGKFINFELSSNGGDGYVYIAGTNFNYRPQGSYSKKEVSAIYDRYWGNGIMTFGFNVSSLKTYYTIFQNVTLSHFPIYDVFDEE